MQCPVKLDSVQRKCLNQIRKASCLATSESDGELYCPYKPKNHATLMKIYGWLLCYYKGDEAEANVASSCLDLYLKYHFNLLSAKHKWDVKL